MNNIPQKSSNIQDVTYGINGYNSSSVGSNIK